MNKPLNRRVYYQKGLDLPDWAPREVREEYTAKQPVEVGHPAMANLVGSKLRDGRHAPVLDLDLPAKLVPSGTPGHSHLYIDQPMSWFKYKVLLRVLSWCRIIEPGYARASIKRGFSAARLDTPPSGEASAFRRALQRLRYAEAPPVQGYAPTPGPEFF